MIEKSDSQLRNVGGVYYMGNVPCIQIVEEALAKPIAKDSGWARHGKPSVYGLSYIIQKQGPKNTNKQK